MNEYIERKIGAKDLEQELLKLVGEYNKLRQTFMALFVTAMNKPIPDTALSHDDYYILHDLIGDAKSNSIDIYLETPGGSGEAAEVIVKCLRSKFEKVSFTISGEAKSAGTIMALSGDEILMTETGSLGPIDAQVKIGRSVISAYDYIEWTEKKRKEAEDKGKLSPFDATMVAQISPGELSGVNNSLKYAEELVTEWLAKYKFKNWDRTETRQLEVTDEMKIKKANEIAAELTNHAKWRTHGRSITANDLEEIGLRVTRLEKDKKLCEVVYRIQTVCRLLFSSTTTYKIFATETSKVFKNATPTASIQTIPGMNIPPQAIEVGELKVKCSKCGKVSEIYAKFVDNPKIDADFQKKGSIAYPKDNKLKCDCGFEIDLSGIRNELEVKVGKKILA
ncbi:ATP-dependent Clp protease proteolytic subunit [Chloroflexota bacterium]